MCGRFTLAADVESYEDDIEHLLVQFRPTPRYNLAPTQDVATVLNEKQPRLVATRWGLVPSWAKDLKAGARMINARAETVHEKPSFKRPLRAQRCLVLADGFYEWKQNPGAAAKTPYYARLRSGRPFAFAGLWDTWLDPARSPVRTCTIITTRPNDVMAPVHDRMPVILPPEHYAEWLSPEAMDAERARALLVPYPADRMQVYPVSTRVNRVAVDDQTCILPA
jgi:putative SOS response-associated peptidase YedK